MIIGESNLKGNTEDVAKMWPKSNDTICETDPDNIQGPPGFYLHPVNSLLSV